MHALESARALLPAWVVWGPLYTYVPLVFFWSLFWTAAGALAGGLPSPPEPNEPPDAWVERARRAYPARLGTALDVLGGSRDPYRRAIGVEVGWAATKAMPGIFEEARARDRGRGPPRRDHYFRRAHLVAMTLPIFCAAIAVLFAGRLLPIGALGLGACALIAVMAGAAPVRYRIERRVQPGLTYGRFLRSREPVRGRVDPRCRSVEAWLLVLAPPLCLVVSGAHRAHAGVVVRGPAVPAGEAGLVVDGEFGAFLF